MSPVHRLKSKLRLHHVYSGFYRFCHEGVCAGFFQLDTPPFTSMNTDWIYRHFLQVRVVYVLSSLRSMNFGHHMLWWLCHNAWVTGVALVACANAFTFQDTGDVDSSIQRFCNCPSFVEHCSGELEQQSRTRKLVDWYIRKTAFNQYIPLKNEMPYDDDWHRVHSSLIYAPSSCLQEIQDWARFRVVG